MLTTRSRCDAHAAAAEGRRRADPALTGRRGTSSLWDRARRAALARDGHRCVQCGSRATLEVDHVDGDPSNNALANLQTLCRPHHREKTAADLAARQAARRRS